MRKNVNKSLKNLTRDFELFIIDSGGKNDKKKQKI